MFFAPSVNNGAKTRTDWAVNQRDKENPWRVNGHLKLTMEMQRYATYRLCSSHLNAPNLILVDDSDSISTLDNGSAQNGDDDVFLGTCTTVPADTNGVRNVDMEQNDNPEPYIYSHKQVQLGKTLISVPASHVVVSASIWACTKKMANVGQRAHEFFHGKSTSLKKETQFLYGLLLSQPPNLSLDDLEKLLSLHQAAIANEVLQPDDIAILLEAAAKEYGERTLHQYTRATAVNCRIKMMQDLKRAMAVFGGFDKGHRGIFNHLAKGLTFFNHIDDCIKNYYLDVDASGLKTKDVANTIVRAIHEALGGSLGILWGQTMDSGGGGVLDNLKHCLVELGMVDNSNNTYKVAPCTLHVIKKALENACTAAFGEAKIYVHNALQAVHTCFSSPTATW